VFSVAIASTDAPAASLYRLSTDLYDRLVETGLLAGEPVELVDGLLVRVTPQGTEHQALVQRLTAHLAARADLLRVQLPLAVPGGRPEPDLALAENPGVRAYPTSAELVCEVCVSSWPEDLTKLPGYADAQVGTVWMVHVPAREVHVFERPDGRRYQRERVLRAGDLLAAPVAGVAPLAVSALFAGLDDRA
jgi:Uma2 family endonuclease